MAIQMLPGPQGDPGLWSGLGHLLGGLAGGAAGYGFSKLTGGEPESKTAEEYVKAGILTPEQARVYSSIKNQTEKNAFLNQAMKQSEARRQAAAMGVVMGGNPMDGQQPMGQQMQQPMGQQMQQPMDQQGGSIESNLQGLGGPQQPQMGDQRSMDEKYRALTSLGLNPQNMSLGAKMIGDIEKNKARERDISSRERTEAFKITSPYRSELAKEVQSASYISDVIKEQKELSKSGKMDSPLWAAFLDKTGLDALKTPETQRYQALEKEFLKDLKSVFGGKVSNIEMEAFLRGVPKATNSKEARENILDRLDAFYKAKKLKFKMSQKIIKENNGIPPLDLQDQVTARTVDKEKEYAHRFLGIPSDAKMIYNQKTDQKAYVTKDGKRVIID